MAFGDLIQSGEVLNDTGVGSAVVAGMTASVVVGDLVVVVIHEQTSLSSTGVTDNLGNSYVAQNAGTDGGTATGRAFYARVTAAGTLTTVTVARSTPANDTSVIAAAFAGPFAVSPVDANPANTSGDITTPYPCPTTGTLSQTIELVIGWMAGRASTATIMNGVSAGSLIRSTENISPESVAINQIVTAATTAVIPNFTSTSGNPSNSVNGTISFKRGSTSTAHVGQATLRGNSTFSTLLAQGQVARATMPGAGGFSARVDRTGTLEAKFEGEGTIGFNATVSGLVAATFQGSGGFSARAQLGAAAQVRFEGAGSFSANSLDLSVRFAVVSFQGAGAFSAQATLSQVASVVYNGAGAFSVLATTWKFAAVTYQGAGSLSLFATIPGASTAWPAEIRFGGNSTFSALARSGQAALAQYGGQSAFTISGLLRNQAQIRFGGAGGFSAYANLRMRVASTFSGTGAFAALLSPTGVVHLGLCRFAGSSDFYCEAARVAAPPPFYDYPIGHGLYSDYGRRASMIGYKPRMIIGRRPK